jgi:2-iminobutanoate/2-iminopropanoate deaminase
MKHINPESLFNSRQYGFSQAVVADANGLFFQTAGQVALDNQEKIIGGSDVGKQTQQALKNLKVAIEAAGGKLTDVMMVRLYIVKLEGIDTTSIGIVLREVFGTENPPASSWIGVTSLARPEFLIEIEAQGIIKFDKNVR